ncbi:MAG: nucleotide-binding protein [Candidatus Dormibacteria bacterium]
MTPLRLTVAGKGGTGKTVIAASLARLMGRAGRRVLAVDADSSPVLAVSLGMRVERLSEPQPIPVDFWEAVTQLDRGRVALLREDPQELLRRHALAAPDAVSLLAGPVAENEGCTADAGVRAMLGVMLGDHGFDCVVTDFEAGVDEPAWALGGLHNPATVLLAVATPSPVAIHTARTIIRLALESGVPRVHGVANQVSTASQAAEIERGLREAGASGVSVIPWDPAIEAADVRGGSPLDGAAWSPGLEAMERLLDEVAREAPAPA